MLKKQLQKNHDLLAVLVREKNDLLNKKDREIKELLKDSEALAHHEKNREQVCQLITSLKSILCPESESFQRQSYDLHRMAESGQQIPERPKDQLFDVLCEIEARVRNGGLTSINLL